MYVSNSESYFLFQYNTNVIDMIFFSHARVDVFFVFSADFKFIFAFQQRFRLKIDLSDWMSMHTTGK